MSYLEGVEAKKKHFSIYVAQKNNQKFLMNKSNIQHHD